MVCKGRNCDYLVFLVNFFQFLRQHFDYSSFFCHKFLCKKWSKFVKILIIWFFWSKFSSFYVKILSFKVKIVFIWVLLSIFSSFCVKKWSQFWLFAFSRQNFPVYRSKNVKILSFSMALIGIDVAALMLLRSE